MRAIKDCVKFSDPEVSARAKHRTFTADEKVQILNEYESAASPIERAAVMRRAGAYSSLISNWRKQLAVAETPEKRDRPVNRDALEVARLRKENERLQRRLDKSERMVDRWEKCTRSCSLAARRERVGRAAVEEVVNVLAAAVGTRTACRMLAVPRPTIYRHRHDKAVVA